MMNIGNRIKQEREKMEISQVDLAKTISVSKQTLYKYESGIVTNVPFDKIELLAKSLNTTPSYLMGWDNNVDPIKSGSKQKKHGVTINVLGKVAADVPLEAVEDIVDTEEISEELAATGDFFGLQINGDSMDPKISRGDIVIIRQQDDADSGDIVIAMINGADATCKRLKKYNDGIMLLSNNPKYEPLVFSNADIIEKPVTIIGRVVELRAKF